MRGERDEEDLEHLLDAHRLPDDGDRLAALLHAASAADTDHVLAGEDEAVAAFRAAQAARDAHNARAARDTPEPPPRPRRRPNRGRIRLGAATALGGATLLALAITALLVLPGHTTRQSAPLMTATATASPIPSPTTATATPTPLPLAVDGTLIPTASATTSATASATPCATNPHGKPKPPPACATSSHAHHSQPS